MAEIYASHLISILKALYNNMLSQNVSVSFLCIYFPIHSNYLNNTNFSPDQLWSDLFACLYCHYQYIKYKSRARLERCKKGRNCPTFTALNVTALLKIT